MHQNQAWFQWLCPFILMIFCLSGCGNKGAAPNSIQDLFKVLDVTDNKIDVEVLVMADKNVSLFIGDQKRGESSSNVKTTTKHISLEVTNRLQLEGGALGHGFIVTISCCYGVTEKHPTFTSKRYISIDKDGQIPYGRVKIRDIRTIVLTDNCVKLADIETPDGNLVPISFKLEQFESMKAISSCCYLFN